MKKYGFIVIASLLLWMSPVEAGSNAAAFSEITLSPWLSAMGHSSSSIVYGVDSIFSNPAGLSGQEKVTVKTYVSQQFSESYYGLGMAMPLWKGALGIGIMHINPEAGYSSEWNAGSGKYEETGDRFGYLGQSLYIGYGQSLFSFLEYGAQVTVISEELATANAVGVGLDIGAKVKVNTPIGEDTKVAVVANRILSKDMAWSTGATDELSKSMQVGVSSWFLGKKILISTDFIKKEDRALRYGVGVMYQMARALSVSAGYHQEEVSLGVTLTLEALRLEYAMVMPSSETSDILDNVSKFSLSYSF